MKLMMEGRQAETRTHARTQTHTHTPPPDAVPVCKVEMATERTESAWITTRYWFNWSRMLWPEGTRVGAKILKVINYILNIYQLIFMNRQQNTCYHFTFPNTLRFYLDHQQAAYNLKGNEDSPSFICLQFHQCWPYVQYLIWYAVRTVPHMICRTYSTSYDMPYVRYNIWYAVRTVPHMICRTYSTSYDMPYVQYVIWYAVGTVRHIIHNFSWYSIAVGHAQYCTV